MIVASMAESRAFPFQKWQFRYGNDELPTAAALQFKRYAVPTSGGKRTKIPSFHNDSCMYTPCTTYSST